MISVIIPALNEEKYIEKTLEALKKQTCKNFEIIVSDGNSTDKTRKIAKKYAKVIISKKRGIGYQQNAGAKYARGNILVFTHADSILSPNTLEEINKAMKKNIVGGSVIGTFEPLNYKIKLLNPLNISVQRLLKITYAYCLFVKKDSFKRIKGFKNIISEDTEIGFRLKRIGKIRILTNCNYKISSRRLAKSGVISNSYLWVKAYLMNKVGLYIPIEKYSVVR